MLLKFMTYQHMICWEKTWERFREEQQLLYGTKLADWDPPL